MEGFSDRLRQQRGRDVLTGKGLEVTVIQEVGEFGLRVLGGSEAGVNSGTIVIGVP
jgi:hypothetical protein